LEGGGDGVEEEGEQVAAFAEDAAQDLGDGEDELAVGDFVADGVGDPLTHGAGATLVAGRAEVAALAGEGEEAFVTTVRALEAGEAGGEVAAAEEGLDGGDGGGIAALKVVCPYSSPGPYSSLAGFPAAPYLAE
jgi:hypothetical protein